MYHQSAVLVVFCAWDSGALVDQSYMYLYMYLYMKNHLYKHYKWKEGKRKERRERNKHITRTGNVLYTQTIIIHVLVQSLTLSLFPLSGDGSTERQHAAISDQHCTPVAPSRRLYSC